SGPEVVFPGAGKEFHSGASSDKVRPFGAVISVNTCWSAVALEPVKVLVIATESQPTTLPFAFFPTVRGTVVSEFGPFTVGWTGIAVGVVLLTVTELAPFFFFFFPSAAPAVSPTVRLTASATTPSRARRDLVLFIRETSPSSKQPDRDSPMSPGI